MKIIKQSPKALSEAVAILKKGGVVISPTDTVYGFIADAGNKRAVETIYRIKRRPRSKPLPLFVRDMAMADAIARISPKNKRVLKKYWPGKYSFILQRKTKTGLYGVAQTTVALRIPDYAFLNTLLRKINKPLVQTSVNVSNQPPMRKQEEIIKAFGRDKRILLMIDGGALRKANPSKILDLTKERLTIIR